MKTKVEKVTGQVLKRIFSDEVYILERLAAEDMVSEHQLWEYGYAEDMLEPVVRCLKQKGLIQIEELGRGPEERYLKLSQRGRFELGLPVSS
jgi:hypothetical protein